MAVRLTPDADDVKGKTVVITGGASGIGAAITTRLAGKGAKVIIGDLNDGTALIAKLRQETGNQDLHFLGLNVTDFSSQQRFFREAAKISNNNINTVIVNAGINHMPEQEKFIKPLDYTQGKLDHPPPDVKTTDVNFYGAMWTVHLATSYLTQMPKATTTATTDTSNDRHILVIASVAGLFGAPVLPLYSAAKHGILGLFRSLRYNARSQGYRLNALCPYFIDTPILGLGGKLLLSGTALTRIEDVVSTATKCISDISLHGRTLAIIPRATAADARSLGLSVSNADITSETEELPVWEVEDIENMPMEKFTATMTRLIDLAGKRKAWVDSIRDFGAALVWGVTSVVWAPKKAVQN